MALTGADCGAVLRRASNDPAPVRVNEVVLMQAQDELELGFAKDGARAYKCLAFIGV